MFRGIVFLIEQISVALYVFIAIAIVRYLWKWRQARRSYRGTQFELERSFARSRTGNALTMVVLLIELGLVISGVQQVVAPTIREQRDLEVLLEGNDEVVVDGNFETATPPAVLATPDLGEIVTLPGNEVGGQVFTTPVPTATFPGTLIPTSDIDPAIGCTSANAMLEIPRHGMIISNPVPIRGSAFIDDFASYHLEIGVPDRGGFTYYLFDVGEIPVLEAADMSQFNPAPYQTEPGFYRIRLMVFDIENILQASCEVVVSISPPLPTPTPLGG